MRDLIQIANRVPNAIVLISCLDDFYGQVRGVLAQSYIDRIEKAGPGRAARKPHAGRSAPHHRQAPGSIWPQRQRQAGYPIRRLFRPAVLRGVRRPLDAAPPGACAQTRLRDQDGDAPSPTSRAAKTGGGFISTLAAALGFGGAPATAMTPSRVGADRLSATPGSASRAQSEAEIPSDDAELLDVLAGALASPRTSGAAPIDAQRRSASTLADDAARHRPYAAAQAAASRTEARVFLCNRPTQGGGLKRQLDRCCRPWSGKSCFMLRACDFPPNTQEPDGAGVPQVPRERRPPLLVPIPEWERMMMVREFHAHHRHDPGFAGWFAAAPSCCRTCSAAFSCCASTCSAAGAAQAAAARRRARAADGSEGERCGRAVERYRQRCPAWTDAATAGCRQRRRGRPTTRRAAAVASSSTRTAAAASSILAGRELAAAARADHAQQGRPEAPRRRARRLRLGQDHAGAVPSSSSCCCAAFRPC